MADVQLAPGAAEDDPVWRVQWTMLPSIDVHVRAPTKGKARQVVFKMARRADPNARWIDLRAWKADDHG